jgi:glycosyltransferase involved in cell wall biosynthesis
VSRPRVTLFVLAYRQEAQVAAAIEGAFAQDGSPLGAPLEILLSDDASPDGTYRVMQAMAAAYAGPHRVRLNRNPRNLGLIGHLNRVMELASGDLLVQNAGDDVSRPDRVARLAAAWAADPSVRAVHSAVRRIDAAGRAVPSGGDRPPMADVGAAEVIADSRPGRRRHLIGASLAWDRRLWEAFGPLPAAALVEDRPIAFRAALTGRIAWLDAPLLDYREGGASDGAGASPRAFDLRMARWQRSFQQAYLADLERADPAVAAALRPLAAAELARLDFEVGLAEAGPAGRIARIPQAVGLALARRDPGPLRSQLRALLRPNP